MRRDNPLTNPSSTRTFGRRDFLRVCSMAAAALGLPASAGLRMAEAATKGLKPSVIWLHFQECTGCTESLLRTSHPALAELILDMISLDYHETLFAAAGHQIEEALEHAMEAHAGEYVCVVEGAIPIAADGVYCKIGGRTAMELLETVSAKAAAVVAIGSCASFGGVAAAPPNPTEARGVEDLVTDKPLINIPGCPANPYNFLGTVMHFVTTGQVPELDDKRRPKFAYGRTIHDDCPRRPHFDAGRFARSFDDAGHRDGYCLYELGCKGPATYANCAISQFGEVNAWPIGVGHPCVGCSEKGIAFNAPMHDLLELEGPLPPGLAKPEGVTKTAVAAGVAGVMGAAVVGAGAAAARKSQKAEEQNENKDASDANQDSAS